MTFDWDNVTKTVLSGSLTSTTTHSNKGTITLSQPYTNFAYIGISYIGNDGSLGFNYVRAEEITAGIEYSKIVGRSYALPLTSLTASSARWQISSASTSTSWSGGDGTVGYYAIIGINQKM